jgi:hypothetical protein
LPALAEKLRLMKYPGDQAGHHQTDLLQLAAHRNSELITAGLLAGSV